MPLSGRPERLRLIQGTIVVVLGFVTLVLALDHRLVFAIRAPALDLVLDTTSAIVALAVAIVGFVRSREAQDAPALYDGAAFLVLAVANTAHIGLIVGGVDRSLGLDPTAPTAAPLYAAAMVRAVSSLLLLAAALPALRARRYAPGQRVAVLVAPTVLLAAACVAVALIVNERHTPADLAALAIDETRRATAPVPGGPVVAALNVSGVVLIGIAAMVRPVLTGGALPGIWLAGALTIGTFGALHSLIFPSPYSGIVTTADVIQVVFYGTLFTALQATRASDLRRTREASDRRRRYHRTDVAAAAQAERLRLARELHDGIVQDLLAVRHDLETATAAAETIHPAAAAPVRPVGEGLAQVITAARRTIDHLRSGFAGQHCLSEELPARSRAFAERYGYALDVRCDPGLVTLCGPRATEILRIVDETLANIQRHADATSVRVSATKAGEQLILTVVDNGRGFVAERTQPGHGITGMLERAELLGGRLTINSAIGEGTQVWLSAPVSSDDAD